MNQRNKARAREAAVVLMLILSTRTRVNALNKLEGYKEIEICTPEEVIEYG